MGEVEELIARLARDGTKVTPAPHPLALSARWLTGAAVYLIVLLAVSGLCPDLASKLQEPWFVAELVSLCGILLATSVSASLLAFPDLHQMRRTAWTPFLAFGIFALVMLLAWRADTPPAPLPAHRIECTLSILFVAAPPAVWMFYTLRKLATTRGRWAGMVAFLSAFSIGALWLRLHETNDSVIHVLQWHYVPMMATGFAGLWLGNKLLKW